MIHFRPSLSRALIVAATALFATSAFAQAELKLMAPAAPGGGWDQTARSMQQVLMQSGIAKSVQVTNVPGAGGSIGIAQFVNGSKGDGSALMVNGFVMMGAILTNKSPVTLEQVTPIARLTAEAEAIVVPPDSPIKSVQDLAAAIKADPSKVRRAASIISPRVFSPRRPEPTRPGSTTFPSRVAAKPWRPSSAARSQLASP